MIVIDAKRDFTSVGQLAANLGQSLRWLEQRSRDLGLKPSLRLNGVPYYDGRQVEQLTAANRKNASYQSTVRMDAE